MSLLVIGGVLTWFAIVHDNGFQMMSQEGFRLPQSVSYAVGAAATILLLVTYLVALLRKQPSSCIIK